MDRARISVSHVDQLALGFGVRADAPRAGALGDLGAVGPELYLGAARGLGNSVELRRLRALTHHARPAAVTAKPSCFSAAR